MKCRAVVAGIAIMAGTLACDTSELPESEPPPVDRASALGKKWQKLGGAEKIGQPVSRAALAPGGETTVQQFTAGVIAYSDDFGAVYLTQRIYDYWLSLQGVPYGSGSLYEYLGPPVEDALDHGTHQSARFKRGEIFDAAGVLRVVSGELYERYLTDTTRELLGLPGSDEYAIGGGRAQAFANATLYWKSNTGARFVAGLANVRWAALGGAAGPLGFPTADTAPVYGTDGAVTGESTRFENGVIYSGPTGAFEVQGQILVAYEEEHGGPAGWLGYPTGGTELSNSDVLSNFQSGMLMLSGGVVKAFGKLSVYVDSIWGTGDDCWHDICDGQDVYAWLSIFVNDESAYYRRLPSHGDCNGYCAVQVTFPLPAVASSGTTIRVVVDGWDADMWPNGDDHLGTIDVTFSAADYWGRDLPDTYDDGDFHARFLVKNEHPYDKSDFLGQMWWSFRNFETPSLSQDQFARTFTDVRPGEEWWRHPFHALFYELYDGVAKGGNCFGMSLESVYAEEGRSPYAEPIWDYFPDTAGGIKLSDSTDSQAPSLIDRINIKHGYQLGADMMLYTVGMFATGSTRNAVANYSMSLAAHSAGDSPLLCVYDSYLFGRAHAVRPYEWTGSLTSHVDCPETPESDSCWTMKIADPKYPTRGLPEASREQTVMSIHLSSNSYWYRDGYSGGESTGGRMFWVPSWLLNDAPVTPLASAFQLINNAQVSFLGASGETYQISDTSGRRLFKEGLAGPPTRWEDVETTASSRLDNLAPITGVGSADPQAIEVYFGTGTGMTHEYRIAPPSSLPSNTPYEWVFTSGVLSSRLLVPGTHGIPDVLAARNIGISDKSVSFQLPASIGEKSITWTIAGPNRDRWAEMRGLRVVSGQRISAWVKNNGQALHFDNDGPETTADLYIKAEPNSPEVHVGPITIGGYGASEPIDFDTPDTTLTFSEPIWGNEGWMKTPVTVTLTVQDYGRGIAKTEYSRAPPEWVTYTAPFPYADEGATKLWYRSLDTYGNQETERSQIFKIDTRAPAVLAWTDAATYERVDPFIVHYNASDPVPGSGLQSTIAMLDATPVADGQAVDLLWQPLGTHALSVTATDVAGWSTTRTATYTLTATSESIIKTIQMLRLRDEITSDGITRSLIAKVAAASNAQTRGERNAAINQLRATINELSAGIVDRHITQRAAELLKADLRFLIETLR